MTEATTKKPADKRIHAMVDAIKPFIAVDEKRFTFGEETLDAAITAFNNEQGEKKPHVSAEGIKVSNEFETDLESALVYATGEVGVGALKADAEIETLKGALKVGTTNFEVTQQRLYTTRNPQFGNEKFPDAPERIEKPGRVDVKRNITGGGAAYSRAVNFIVDMAGDAL